MREWKETDFGLIPDDWEISTLGQICDFITDGSHSSPRPLDSLFYMASVKDMRYDHFDFSDCKTISKADFDSLDNGNCSPQKGDILLSKDGANCLDLIFVYKQPEKIVLLSSIAIARLKKGFDPDYYRFFLLSPNAQFLMRNNFISGSAIPRVVLKDFRNVPVPLIPLDKQKDIASVLCGLDDKINLLHRQNTTLEAMAETLFRQWFVEEAKEDWEVGNLGQAIEIFDNLRIPLSKMERDKKKDGPLYPYYGAAKIMDYINDYIFEGEYILLGEDGTVRTPEGYPVLQYATGKFWVNNHTHVIQAKSPYNNFFVWNYLRKMNIDEIITGAVQPKINQGNLRSLAFPKFPKKLILEFNELLGR